MFFLAGMVLILAEFVLPGAVLGVIGGVLILISTGLGIYAFPEWTALLVAGEFVGAFLFIVIGLFVVSKTGYAGGLALRTSQHAEDGYVNVPSDRSLIGATGVVYTALRPAGSVIVNNERIDAVSNGLLIPKDSAVRVVEVHGNRVVVEPLEETVS
ncbi:MAG: hypothetical protein HYS27_19000 [Deltaproteobacteria bacterium]|nr:hypothetical protein [Deltaproteobacteria bacterium]